MNGSTKHYRLLKNAEWVLKSAIGAYGYDIVMLAIAKYGMCYRSTITRTSYNWTLWEFLSRGKGEKMEKYVETGLIEDLNTFDKNAPYWKICIKILERIGDTGLESYTASDFANLMFIYGGVAKAQLYYQLYSMKCKPDVRSRMKDAFSEWEQLFISKYGK